MATQEFRFDPGANILVPSRPSPLNRKSPSAFGASLTLPCGLAMARKTSDGKLYPLNSIATDGTQTFAGFNEYTCATDASGLVYLVGSGTSAGSTYFSPPSQYSSVFTGGIFNPNDLFTSATGTPVAEIDTVTPAGTITAADNFVIQVPASPLGPATTVSFVAVSGSVTPTNIVTGLKAAWAADPTAVALATASGTATLVLTAVKAGEPMNLTTYCEGVGTFVNVVTAGTSAVQSEVDTFTATNPTTADVYTLTITYPNLTTHAVSATVGATQTATAIDALLLAAWNADPVAAAYATPSGTTTLIMTAVTPGNSLNIAGTTVGTGTIAKVVTKPALGRTIGDILPGAPGARVLPITGEWEIP